MPRPRNLRQEFDPPPGSVWDPPSSSVRYRGPFGAAIAAIAAALLLLAACDPDAADFGLALSTRALELRQGEAGSVTVAVESVDGFAAPIALHVEGAPPGVAAAFDANPTRDASTLTLEVALDVEPATLDLTVVGDGGTLQRRANLVLVVRERLEPDFDLRPERASLAVAQGTSDEVAIEVIAAGGFADPVAFSVGGDLGGIEANFDPNPAAGTTTLRLNVAEEATLGDRSLVLIGSADGRERSRPLLVRVASPFGGDRLEEVISAEEPPDGPVRIGKHLEIEFVGRRQLVAGPAEQPDFGTLAAPPVDDVERDWESVDFHVFNVATRNEFRVTFGRPLLEAVHTFQTERGRTLGTVSVENPHAREQFLPIPTRTAPQARSDGNDNRAVIGATTSWPWRTVAHFSNNCSGTLVGPRHVITAAHCVNAWGTDTFFTFTVRPGRDGSGDGSEPFGASTLSNPLPPGQSGWYWTPTRWRDPDGSDSRQYDWALVVLPDRLGDQTGWMGYVARGQDALAADPHYNRGYPWCGSSRPDTPDPCQPMRLYGNVFPCELGSFSNRGADGWARTVFHDCDTSAGHSGSPVYHYVRDPQLDDRWVPVVGMVHTWSACDRTVAGELVECGASDDFPSLSVRLTPSRLALISHFRNTWP